MIPKFRLEDINLQSQSGDSPTTIRTVEIDLSKRYNSRCDCYDGHCGCSVADSKEPQRDYKPVAA